MAAFRIKLPRTVSGRELLAAVEIASTEGRYHSSERSDRTLFAGQYNFDGSKSLLVSNTPRLCRESGIKLDAEYSIVWLIAYKWSLPYDPSDSCWIDETSSVRFAERIIKALSQS
jgi:hypothetical protein